MFSVTTNFVYKKNENKNIKKIYKYNFVWLFVLLLYVPSQQLLSWRDGQFTLQHYFPGQAWTTSTSCPYFRL